MGQQINISINMDKDIKEQAETLFSELGYNFTTAVNAFVDYCLREKEMPFERSMTYDEYFNEANMKSIMKSIQQMEEGKVVIKTMEELEAMTNE